MSEWAAPPLRGREGRGFCALVWVEKQLLIAHAPSQSFKSIPARAIGTIETHLSFSNCCYTSVTLLWISTQSQSHQDPPRQRLFLCQSGSRHVQVKAMLFLLLECLSVPTRFHLSVHRFHVGYEVVQYYDLANGQRFFLSKPNIFAFLAIRL